LPAGSRTKAIHSSAGGPKVPVGVAEDHVRLGLERDAGRAQPLVLREQVTDAQVDQRRRRGALEQQAGVARLEEHQPGGSKRAISGSPMTSR
jgi:hypothetical protein